MSTAEIIGCASAILAVIAAIVVVGGSRKTDEEQARDDDEQMNQLRRTTHRIDATHARRICAEHRELSEIERAYRCSQFN